MFQQYFSAEPAGLDATAAKARRQRQREVENALLSQLMSGFKLTEGVRATLQAYIDGSKSREKAFGFLYEVHAAAR